MREESAYTIREYFFQKKSFIKYAMVIPALGMIFGLLGYPLLVSIRMSFVEWTPLLPDNPFVGIDNYVRVLSSPRFWNAIRVTFTIIGIALPIELCFGFAIALLFNRKFAGKKLLFPFLFLPLMINLVVVGLTAHMAFNQYYGFVNYLIEMITRRSFSVDWFAHERQALTMLIITDIWRWTPFVAIILLSGLTGLPIEPYESAQIDGANKYKIFRFITLPQMKYPILVALLIRLLQLIQFFDVLMLTTRGGPGTATETVSFYIYEYAFSYWHFGFAAAATFVLLGIVSLVVMGFVKLLTGRE